MNDLPKTQITSTYRCEHIFNGSHIQQAGNIVEWLIVKIESVHLVQNKLATFFNIFVAVLQFKPVRNFRARPSSVDIPGIWVEPITTWMRRRVSKNFDLLSGIQTIS